MSKIIIPDKLAEKQQEADDKIINKEKPYANEEWTLSWSRIAVIWFGVASFIVTVFIFLWHHLAPVNLRWLSGTDLDKISTFTLSIVVGILISATTTYLFTRKK